MTITSQPLTNGASWARTLKPTVLLCAHITDNMGTAAQQVHYANRPGSGGPSAHDYLDPTGSGLEALNPAQRCAWSNGDVQGPNLSLPTVKAAVVAHVNPNKIVYREVECVGDGAHPVTGAQLEQLAQFVAADAKLTGLPINRSTVTTHADWNSVTRNNCAFPPSVREARLASVIARANAILHPAPVPAPAPVTYTLHVGAGAKVYVVPVNGSEPPQITGNPVVTTWGPTASSAPCSMPQTLRGTYSGQASCVYVPKGAFAGKWVHAVSPGVSVTHS